MVTADPITVCTSDRPGAPRSPCGPWAPVSPLGPAGPTGPDWFQAISRSRTPQTPSLVGNGVGSIVAIDCGAVDFGRASRGILTVPSSRTQAVITPVSVFCVDATAIPVAPRQTHQHSGRHTYASAHDMSSRFGYGLIVINRSCRRLVRH